MQQNKIEILCTGQLDDVVVQAAAEQGFYIDRVPFIGVNDVTDPKIGEEIAFISQQQKTVIFTSANAVKAVLKTVQNRKPDWKIYCMVGSTRNLIADSFGENTIRAVAHSSGELAKIISDDFLSGEIIFFCGNIRREELPDQLKKNHILLKEIVVYETVLLPCRVEKKYDGILFFSPSEVKSFFSLNKPDADSVLFAIGETTATEIKNHTTNTIIVSPIPGKPSLVDRAIEYFHSRSKQPNRSQFTKHE
jgi:uroporphyrinogen-III synthase